MIANLKAWRTLGRQFVRSPVTCWEEWLVGMFIAADLLVVAHSWGAFS